MWRPFACSKHHSRGHQRKAEEDDTVDKSAPERVTSHMSHSSAHPHLERSTARLEDFRALPKFEREVNMEALNAAEPLLDRLNTVVPFCDGRWQCVCAPERAGVTLGPCEKLELTVVKARRLIPHGSGSVLKRIRGDHPSPYVSVLLNEDSVDETAHVREATEPQWNHSTSIDVTIPKSMIRLMVYDHARKDDVTQTQEAPDFLAAEAKTTKYDPLGFVEFCIGDMPYDEEIEGWLELRFGQNLQGTSLDRYAEHCAQREDAAHEEEPDSLDRMTEVKVIHSGRLSGMAKRFRPTLTHKQEEAERAATPADHYRYNGGEILVRMRLVRLGSWLDSTLALSLIPPVVTFTTIVRQDNLPKLDLQELVDDAIDIKIAVIDNFLLCMANWMVYIFLWRSRLLSAGILVWMIFLFLSEDMLYFISHLLGVILMLMNASPRIREEMTTGGLNAALTDKGLGQVARWENPWQMELFIQRLLSSRGYGCNNDRRLSDFAGHVFAPGQPLVPLESMMEVLKQEEWIEKKENIKIRKGQLVRVHVDGDRRGTVEKVTDNEVAVSFDEPPEPRANVFEKDHLIPRLQVPGIPKIVLSKSLQDVLKVLCLRVDQVKSNILPTIEVITDIVCWRRPAITGPIFLYFFLRSILSFIKLVVEWSWLHKAVWILRKIKVVVCAVVCITLFISNAQVFKWLFSIGRILGSLAVMRRQAPTNWSFMTPVNAGDDLVPASYTSSSQPLLQEHAEECRDSDLELTEQGDTHEEVQRLIKNNARTDDATPAQAQQRAVCIDAEAERRRVMVSRE